MGGFDYSLIPTIFLVFQAGVLGFFVLIHFILGLKRGVVKSVWYFAAQVAFVFGLFYVLGFIQLKDYLNEDLIRQIGEFASSNLGLSSINGYIDQIITSGGLPLVVSIVDLVVKIVLFIVIYTLARFLVTWIFAGIPWLFIKPMVKNLPKQRFLGGVIGIARGAFSGFIVIFPLLILINTVVGQGIEIENSEYKELATQISKANEQNFVKIINDTVKIDNVGVADLLFDLGFKTKTEDDKVIVWRTELAWIAEAAKAIAPELLNQNQGNSITLERIEKFEGFFAKFSESVFLDSALKPGIKIGLSFIKDDEMLSHLTDEEFNELLVKIDGTEISLSEDLNDIFLAVKDLLSIQDYDSWIQMTSNIGLIGDFNQEEQTKFISALTRIVNLDLINLVDVATDVVLFLPQVKEQITWLDTPEEKVIYLKRISEKINSFEGSVVSSSLNQLVKLLQNGVFKFPGIDKDNDGIADVSLADFISNLTDFTVLLNKDSNYHTWFKGMLTDISDISLIDIMLEPLIDFGTHTLRNSDMQWTDEDFNMLVDIINTNMSDSEDLKRELIWIADVYRKIGNLEVGESLLTGVNPIEILDALLSDTNSQVVFKDLVNHLLDGQTISSLTSQMSKVLIDKFITEPLELKEPLVRAANLQSFSFNNEIKNVVDVLINLYDSGFMLGDVMAEGTDLFSNILPVIVDFVKNDDNKTKLLNSNILYSFIDYNLQKLEGITVPVVALEVAGNYNGWIKKTEISSALDVLDGLITEMDNQGVSIAEVFGSEDMINQLFPVIKAYAASEENRTTLLSSDILYYTLSDTFSKLDAFEVPETAKVKDVNSGYNGWIDRTELARLLEALVILDIDLPQGNEQLSLDGITGDKLNEVIKLESRILQRLITTQLVNANIFTMPEAAFETTEKLDLNQNELEGLGDLLVTLNVDLGSFMNGNGSNDILDTIYLENLTNIRHEGLLVIQSFITYGIKTAIADIHELAFDKDYPEMLSSTEIGELFKVLKSIDKTPSLSIGELSTSIDPEALTFEDINNIIDSGDSIVIRGLISKNILETDMIAELNIKDDAYHNNGGNVEKTLLSYNELKALVNSLGNMADSNTDPIMSLVSNLDINTITTGKVSAMVESNSSIIRTLISKEILKMEDFKVHPAAINGDEIYQQDLEDLFEALELGLGNDTTVSELGNLSNDLSISNLRLINSGNSRIVSYLMSDMIIESIGEEYDRVLAHDTNDNSLLSNQEFTSIFDALAVIDPTEESPVVSVAENIDNLELQQVGQMVSKGSHILRARLSSELITQLTPEKIHPSAIDENDDIKQDDLNKLFKALNHMGPTKKITELGNITDELTIGQVRLMNAENSVIVNGMISSMIIESIGSLNIRSRAYDQDDLALGINMFGLLNKTELDNLFTALYVLADSNNNALISGLTDSLSDTNTLTLGKVSSVVGTNSIIISSMISKEMIPVLGTNSIHPETLTSYATPNTLDLTEEIKSTDLIAFFEALEVLGEETTVSELSTKLSNNLTVGTIQAIRNGNSKLFEGKLSSIIGTTLLDQDFDIREAAYHNYNDSILGIGGFKLLSNTELTNLLEALASLDSNDSPISNIITNFDEDSLTTQKLVNLVSQNSIIIDTMMGSIIIDLATPSRIIESAYDDAEQKYLTRTEMMNFIESIALFDNTYNNNDDNDDMSISELTSNLASTIDSVTLNLINQLLNKESSIMRKYLSEGIITALVPAHANNQEYDALDANDRLRSDVFENYGMKLINKSDIEAMVLALGKLTSEPLGMNTPLNGIVSSLDSNVSITLLRDVITANSVIINRKVTNLVFDANISVPQAALETHSFNGVDISQTEFENLFNSLEAIGLTTFDMSNINAEEIGMVTLLAALNEDSHIMMRLVSTSLIDLGIATAESRTNTEDPAQDVQADEVFNLLEAFIALGINDLASTENIQVASLLQAAISMPQEDFDRYIDLGELDENQGLTIVKAFLSDKLEGVIRDKDNFTIIMPVSTRQELHDAIYQ